MLVEFSRETGSGGERATVMKMEMEVCNTAIDHSDVEALLA